MNPTRPVVLDTNVVLDLFVFGEPGMAALKASIEARERRWIATDAMRDELRRVLGYPNIVRWLARRGHDPIAAACDVLARFDAGSTLVTAPAAAAVLCEDPDDQMFIDLAAAHEAELVSRDRLVLAAWRRLEARSLAKLHARA